MSVYSGSENDDDNDDGSLRLREELEQPKEAAEAEDKPRSAVPERILSPKTASSEYVSCASELEVSSPRGSRGSGLLTTPPESYETAHTRVPENSSTGQLRPQPSAGDSDIVKPKPRVVKAGSSYPAAHANLATVFQTANEAPPPSNLSPPSAPPSSLGDDVEELQHGGGGGGGGGRRHRTSSPEGMSPSPLGGFPTTTGDGPLQSYLFPISNSPMDVVTMLSRLASFTGELLLVLTPKIRKTTFELSKVSLESL